MFYPPLPLTCNLTVMRIRANKWKHLSDQRKLNFYKNVRLHINGFKRRHGMDSLIFRIGY